MSTMTIITNLSHIHCPECGGLYAIAQNFIDEARRMGGFKKCWTCPYCKSERGYGESEADKLKAQIANLQSTERWLRERSERAEKDREHFRKSRDGMKGVLTKVKNRIKHGVCPCCKRTFDNLARHMNSKHPGFAKEEEPKQP